jgi:outer membrane protein assembly factor BamB
MRPNRVVGIAAALSCSIVANLICAGVAAGQWPQFGGPGRDFQCDDVALETEWPETGPRVVWSQAFGDGYSGIALEGRRLVSMYRDGDDEIVACLDADTGRTLWSHRYRDPVDGSRFAARYGYGPRSTPLIVNKLVFTAGFNGKLHCLELATGQLKWSADLVRQFKAVLPRWGYANSPIAFGETIILPIGGPGAALVAFDQTTGRVIWRRHDFENSYGSPIIVEVDGLRHMACLMAKDIIGFDPADGRLLWRHAHEGQWLNNIPNPVVGPDNTLLVTSEGEAGTRLLKLSRVEEDITVRELWWTRKFRVVHRNVMRIGEVYYGSSGDFGPSVFCAVDARTGELRWRNGTIGRCGMLLVGEKLLMLVESGELMLATPGAQELTIHARAHLLDYPAWTIPSLVGKRLYLRDRRNIMAVELP